MPTFHLLSNGMKLKLNTLSSILYLQKKKKELIVVVLVFKSITIEQGPHFHNFWRRLQIFLLQCVSVPKQLLYL